MKLEQYKSEKDPYIDVFNTVNEFVVSLEKKKGISVTHTEPIKSNTDTEVVAVVGSDGYIYLLDQSQGKVMFIQTTKNWDAAIMSANAYLEKKN